MSDSETDHSSEDDDWVPEGNESDSSEPEEESKEKKKTSKESPRKRRGGIKLGQEEDEEEVSDDSCEPVEDSELDKLRKEKQEASSKARIEDLWADFKKDTKTTPARKTSSTASLKATALSSIGSSAAEAKAQQPKAKEVTITKTYDFAGEAVTVTKTVDADSAEAKAQHSKAEARPPAAGPVIPSQKRPAGGLSSVLGQLGKKPKLSTLEKSKYDWDTFKKDEGIEEELKNFNKDGYLEKKSFLHRTDERQFERERDVRLGMRKM